MPECACGLCLNVPTFVGMFALVLQARGDPHNTETLAEGVANNCVHDRFEKNFCHSHGRIHTSCSIDCSQQNVGLAQKALEKFCLVFCLPCFTSMQHQGTYLLLPLYQWQRSFTCPDVTCLNHFAFLCPNAVCATPCANALLATVNGT